MKQKEFPKVSVIVPVYNTERYLNKCLESIINQSLKDIEIICINDGSTDNSQAILHKFCAKDNRIIIINQDNHGPAKARQEGIKIAKGEYIGFVDSDDFIGRRYFESLYKNAKKFDADISMTNHVILYDNGKEKKKKCGVPSNAKIITSVENKAEIIITTGMCCNKIYKKSFIDKNNLIYTGYHPGEDNIFNAVTVIKADKIIVSKCAKYYYVQVKNSIVHSTKKNNDFTIFDNYKYIDTWINEQEDLSKSEKEYWKYINYQRKKRDFDFFYNNMDKSCEEKFKILVEKNLKIDNLVISLTSYPERITFVNQAINSLLNQTIKAEKIILWLALEEFPNKENDLPEQLIELVPKGLTIDWYKNIGSYKKIIPTLIKYPNKLIVTADDDLIYEKDWLEKLYRAYLKEPNLLHCHRIHKIAFKKGNLLPYNSWEQKVVNTKPSFNNFPTSGSGILFSSNTLYKDVLREDLFMELSPQADDIWLWAMAVLNGTKINKIDTLYKKLTYVEGSQKNGLWKSNVLEDKNDIQLENVLEHYPEIIKKLDKSFYIYNNFAERIFSIKKYVHYKIITILGIRIKIKKIKEIKNNEIKNLCAKLNVIEKCQDKLRYEICKYMPEEKYPEYLKDWYYEKTGNFLNLENPQTFSEKIQWLKLYDSTLLKTQLADKYLVRNWIKEKIGEEYLVPLLGVWDKFDDIDFNILPDRFVLKCNHGCGYNIIVKNKSMLNYTDVRTKINTWMNENYAFNGGLELHYLNIPKKIIAEKYIPISESNIEIQCWCFNGEIKFISYETCKEDLFPCRCIFNKNWEKLNFKISPKHYHDFKTIPGKPKYLEELIYIVNILCQGFYHVRIDFIVHNGNIKFREMTFTSASGMSEFEPKEHAYIIGQMLNLPINNKIVV